MKTFLINYVLRISFYMGDRKDENKSILVEAENEDMAKKTLDKYWEKKSNPYDITYYVIDSDVTQKISQIDIL